MKILILLCGLSLQSQAGIFKSGTVVNLSTSQITGTVPTTSGGTGATSLTQGGVLYGNGTSAVGASSTLQTGSNGAFTVNGASTTMIMSGAQALYSIGGSGIRVSSSTSGNDLQIICSGNDCYFADWNTGTKGLKLNTNSGAMVVFSPTFQVGSGGTPLSVISTGAYTPTLFNTTNVAASVAFSSATYFRIGNIVQVAGEITIDPTSAASNTELGISIPIASNFTASTDLAGSIGSNLGDSAYMTADAGNDRIYLQTLPSSNANAAWSFTFQYTIK